MRQKGAGKKYNKDIFGYNSRIFKYPYCIREHKAPISRLFFIVKQKYKAPAKSLKLINLRTSYLLTHKKTEYRDENFFILIFMPVFEA